MVPVLLWKGRYAACRRLLLCANPEISVSSGKTKKKFKQVKPAGYSPFSLLLNIKQHIS